MHHAPPSVSATLSAFGLALACGLNATFPLVLIGLLGRVGLITLAPPFDALETNVALVCLAALMAVEVIGDKVPGVDHLLHAVMFPVSVAAGAILFATQTHAIAQADPGSGIVMSLVLGGGTAAVTHLARATVRPLTHVALIGPFVSLAEDVYAGSLTLSALFLPALVPVIILALLACLLGLLIFLFKAAWNLVEAALRRRREPAPEQATLRT